MERIAFVILVLVLVLLACSALADNDHPVNPYRKDVIAFEKVAREIREQARRESGGLQANDALKGLNVTCNRQPAMNGTGSWSISLQGHSASQVKQMTFFLGMKDWTDDYTHIHWIQKNQGEDDAVFINSYTSPKIVTSGNYQVYFYVVYTDGDTAYYFHEFTISGTDALRSKINTVAAAQKAGTQWQTALNLHDWLTHNLYYDTNYEYYGADSILRGYGVCDSYSKIYLLLCQAAGIQVKRVTNVNHAWNVIKLDGKWYYVDCTWDDPAGVLEKISGSEHHSYFCLNKTLMALDHPSPWEWSDSSEPSCTSLDANYIVHTGEWRKWGDYGWEYETGYFVDTLSEQIANAFESGEKQFFINWTERAEEYGTPVLWYMEDGELKSLWADKREQAIIGYVLPKASFELDGGSVKAAVTATSSKITLRMSGWDITEKGTLKLPEGLKSVPEESFRNTAATTLIIRPGCRTIGAGAFKNSGIRTVTIPASVTQIADDAFDGCGRIILKTTNTAAIQYAAEHNMLVIDP